MKIQLILLGLMLSYSIILSGQQHEFCDFRVGNTNLITTRNLEPSVVTVQYTPGVLSMAFTGDLVIEVITENNPSSLVLNTGTENIMLHDDGLTEDKVKGDGIFTAKYSVNKILTNVTDQDAYRPFLGFLELYSAGNLLSTYNLFFIVKTDDIPLAKITNLGLDMQATDRVVNIAGATLPIVNTTSFYLKFINEFYTKFDDEYDFLSIVIHPGIFENANHWTLQNGIENIGLDVYKEQNYLGNKTKLKGVNNFPLSVNYDAATVTFNHEFAHQYINFLNVSPFDTGIPHWPYSNVGTGIMGVSIGGYGGQGGRFPYKFTKVNGGYDISAGPNDQNVLFNDWELYLMGLFGPNEVKEDAVIFKDQSITFPQTGFYETAKFNTLSIDQIIQAIGTRFPGVSTSQKKFKIATLILSEHLLSQDEMDYFDHMTKRASLKEKVIAKAGFLSGFGNPFYVATGGRGELDVILKEGTVSNQSIYAPDLFQIHPNPFKSFLEINYSLPLQNITLEMLTIQGTRLMHKKLENGTHTIDCPQLSPGVYFIRITSGDHYGLYKMVKA